MAREVAEQARVEDPLGKLPAVIRPLEAVAVLAGEDGVQTLGGHLQHREVAARAAAWSPSTRTVTLVIWCSVLGVPSSWMTTLS